MNVLKKGLFIKLRPINLLILGIFFISTLVGCNGGEEKPVKPEAKGFQWEVSKGDKKMYLIGTMHPINRDFEYFNSNINKIIDETDILAVEIDPSEEEMVKSNAEGVYSGEDTIENELSKKQIENLKSICKETGIDYEKLKVLKPVIIVNNLQSVLYSKANLTMDTFDSMLINTFKNNKDKVLELESLEEQMSILEEVNGIDALKYLLDNHKDGNFFKDNDESITYSKNLMDAYAKGDIKVMEEAVNSQKDNPYAYEVLIKNRNEEMVKKMENFIKEDKVYTIAVGALHFFGKDGIVHLMKLKGYEVNIIE